MCDVDPDESGLEALAGGADAEVTPSGVLFARLPLTGEEVVSDVGALGRKYLYVAREERIDLIRGTPDGRGRGHDLGTHSLAVHFPGAELVDRRLVKPDKGAERPTYEV